MKRQVQILRGEGEVQEKEDSKMVHITYVVHAIYKVAEERRLNFQNVN